MGASQSKLNSLTQKQIADFVRKLGNGKNYADYADAIKDDGVDGKFLVCIKSDEEFKKLLAELGIKSDIHKKKLLSEWQAAKQQENEVMSTDALNELIMQNVDRRASLEHEKEENIPEIKKNHPAKLGEYFKFVNREASINILIKHSAKQYHLYLQKGGVQEHEIQWAACSGGPGLGKTTFCRKAFTRSIDSLQGEDSDTLWRNVPTKQDFLPVVQACVETGRQYQISFGGSIPDSRELRDPEKSFSYRLLKCLTKGTKEKQVSFEHAPALQEVLSGLTKGKKESLIVVNFDETNKVLEMAPGKTYLMNLLAAVANFNARQEGFVFCIMSGTNVRDLHNTLKAASHGNAPLEIPLPLLSNEHMVEILEDLANRANKSSAQSNLTDEKELKFVVTALGGVPRYVEALAFRLGANPNFDPSVYVDRVKTPPNPLILLTDIRNNISKQYGDVFEDIMTTATRKVWEALVCASLFSWQVSRETLFGKHSVQVLESRGVLFVKTTQDATTRAKVLTIVFPLLFLTYILQKTSDCPMLLRHFDVPLSSDENERNTLAILLLKCNGLRTLGIPITIDALLPGYAPNLSWRATPLEFDKRYLRAMENQITMKTWDDFELQMQRGEDGFFVNAKSATFADGLIIPKGTENVILVQEKQVQVATRAARDGTTVPRFGYDSVKEEHDKCNVKTPHLFIMVSDKDFEATDRDKIKSNEVVLPRSEHGKALGPLLALLRRHNHGYRPKLPLKKRKRANP